MPPKEVLLFCIIAIYCYSHCNNRDKLTEPDRANSVQLLSKLHKAVTLGYFQYMLPKMYIT